MSNFPNPSLFRRLLEFRHFSNNYKRSINQDHSFGNEWEILRQYLELLNIISGQVVDVAASDGVIQSCTLPLFRDPAWSGLAVEMDPVKFAKLAYVYAGYDNCRLARCRVTPKNICALLSANEVPQDFEVLNLDIDSYDLFVAKEMLSGGYCPKLISMEINEKIPPPIFFTVLYEPNHYWKGDHFFGCSLVAAAQTIGPFGYSLASVEYNNAFFVRSDFALDKIINVSVTDAYDTGYRNKSDRKELFPWNADVECALEMNGENSLLFFSEFFEKYKGKFDLWIVE